MAATSGDLVHGHRLIERIGGGHFGEVWRADHLGHPVALKILHGRPRSSPEILAQVALGRLPGGESAYFPRVDHVDLEADPPYLRMEFIHGRPLEEALTNPALSLERRLEIGSKILEGLAIIHRHDFIHGDLSPSNILCTPDGGVRLIDVGFGKILDEGTDPVPSSTAEMQANLGVASPLYAAPERFKAEFLEGCGEAADVFSFGKILYRLITGESPFVIKPVSLRFKALGGAWDDFLFRCLEERPENRFADAGEALEVYRRIYRPEPVRGQYRSACPQCKRKMNLPGGWAGERFPCGSCGAQLEVLFYDEDSREAVVDFVMSFLEGPGASAEEIVTARAVKFCPACGESILVEAKRCRHCGTWADEYARKIARPAPRCVPNRSFASQACYTVLGYLFFWLPGAILNCCFWAEARRVRRETGREPEGMVALTVMLWLFSILPAAAVAGLLLIAFLGAALS